MATPDFVNQYRDVAGWIDNGQTNQQPATETPATGLSRYANQEFTRPAILEPAGRRGRLADEPYVHGTVIEYPGLHNSPSGLIRTTNGRTVEQALRYNDDIRSGRLTGELDEDIIEPQNDPGFLDKYRNTTKQLGLRANTNNISRTAENIMKKLWLPSYYDVLSDDEKAKMKADYDKYPGESYQEYEKQWKDFADMTYKYRVRAAQVLEKMSDKEREKIYTLLNANPVEGKNALDNLIKEREAKENAQLEKLASPFIKALRGVNEGVANAINKVIKSKGSTDSSSEGSNSGTDKKSSESNSSKEEAGETIEYTYKPGDTFGQVITNLGLKTSNGLWGPNGDVEYYTKQLMDQGVWPDGVRGNIPVGTTIKLRRRK